MFFVVLFMFVFDVLCVLANGTDGHVKVTGHKQWFSNLEAMEPH